MFQQCAAVQCVISDGGGGGSPELDFRAAAAADKGSGRAKLPMSVGFHGDRGRCRWCPAQTPRRRAILTRHMVQPCRRCFALRWFGPSEQNTFTR